MAKFTKRSYTPEFKRQAVQLSYDLGIQRAAEQLGISGCNVSNWRKGRGNGKATRGNQTIDSTDEELRRLRAENAEQKKVIQILKGAAAFFSKDHLK